MPIWAWTEVAAWLHNERSLDLDETLPTLQVLTQLENCLMRNPDHTTVAWHQLEKPSNRGQIRTRNRTFAQLIRISADDVDASPEAVGAIIDATTPVSVRIDEVAAGPVRQPSFDNRHFELIRGIPAFAIVDDGQTLVVRLEHSLQVSTDGDDDQSEFTTISVFHVAAFDCHKELETSPDALSVWIETNVHIIVYPYVRQFFTMMTADMGMPPVVLG